MINSAGVARPGYVEELPSKSTNGRWISTITVRKHGQIDPSRNARARFRHIINISSIAGVIGVLLHGLQRAKFAVKGFSDCLRTELKPKGITVSVLYPPIRHTATGLGRPI